MQDQLVEYISSQLKLGVSRDAVKSALTSVGWAPLDIEDTLKKIESAAPAPAATPLGAPQTAQQAQMPQKGPETSPAAAASPKYVSFSPPGTATGGTKSPETIRVSDLVSSAPAAAPPGGAAPKVTPVVGTPAVAAKAPPALIAQVGGKKKGIGLLGILAIVLIVLLGALSGYLFFRNNNLNAQLQAQLAQNQSVAQGATTQIQALNASNTALVTQVSVLNAQNQDLATNLSLLATTSTPPASSTILISGVLSAGLGKNTFILTTTYGVRISIKNSSVSLVAAALQPLLGQTIQVSGTYILGTPGIDVETVNGASVLPAPPAAPTSMATSTVPAKAATTTP